MQRSCDALGLKRNLFQSLAPILSDFLAGHLPWSPACHIHVFTIRPLQKIFKEVTMLCLIYFQNLSPVYGGLIYAQAHLY